LFFHWVSISGIRLLLSVAGCWACWVTDLLVSGFYL